MSILGYSTSYFLPEYWANTPLYGEKIIPLLDYILSMDYENADSLAQAFYNIENKYKNQVDLPIEVVEAIIEENGYGYVKDLLGDSEESMRLLLSLMVLVHQLKGTKMGIMAVLNLLRRDNSMVTFRVMGDPTITQEKKIISDFSVDDYAILTGFNAEGNSVELNLGFGGFLLGQQEQCIVSVSDYGLYIGIDLSGHLILSLSSNRVNWDIANRVSSTRALSAGNSYYLRLLYDGYDYSLQVSADGKNYETWIFVESTNSLNINNGTVYLGVDSSEGELKYPFTGYINYSDFSVGVENIAIEQWFEQMPVGPENTFIIKTNLEADLISADFFSKFAQFIKNYVYPSLTAFIATLSFKGTIAFVSYARSKVTYICDMDLIEREAFLVRPTLSAEATDPFMVNNGSGIHQDFVVATRGGSNNGGNSNNVQYGYVTSREGISLNGVNGAVITNNLVTYSGNTRACIMSNIDSLADEIADNSWEIVTKVNNFKGGSIWLGLYNTGLSGSLPSTATYCNFTTNSRANYKWAYEYIYTTSSNNSYATHSLGETFNGFVKFEYNKESDQYIVSYSTDNKATWTAANTYNSPGVTSRNQVVFVSLYQGVAGEINFDLEETYLTINGVEVWRAQEPGTNGGGAEAYTGDHGDTFLDD